IVKGTAHSRRAGNGAAIAHTSGWCKRSKDHRWPKLDWPTENARFSWDLDHRWPFSLLATCGGEGLQTSISPGELPQVANSRDGAVWGWLFRAERLRTGVLGQSRASTTSLCQTHREHQNDQTSQYPPAEATDLGRAAPCEQQVETLLIAGFGCHVQEELV